MQEKVHIVENTNIVVRTDVISAHPPTFRLTARHPDGTNHECSLTVGDADLNHITNIEEAQKHLDAAREGAAQMCYKKSILNGLVAQLQ